MRRLWTCAYRLSSGESWSGNEVRMRSGDPGPDRPRARREGPDLTHEQQESCQGRVARRSSVMPSLSSFAVARGCLNVPDAAQGSAAKCVSWVRPRYPQLRSRALRGANVLRVCRAAAPPPAKAHRRAARSAFAFPNSSATPTHSSARNLISAGRQCKMPLPALGWRLVGCTHQPLGCRIVLYQRCGDATADHR